MNILNIIQEIWLIEEKAKSFRSKDWLIPPIAPTIADKVALIPTRSGLQLYKVYIKRYNGPTFWTVIKIKPWGQVNPSITCGNQKWKGAAPSFNNKAVVIKIIKLWLNTYSTVPIMIRAEPKAWTKKYFKDASDIYWLSLELIKGIKDIKFNSSPHQAPNQDSEEIDRIVPVVKPTKKTKAMGFKINIKKREIKVLIGGIWAQ